MTTTHFIHAASMTAALCLAACIPQESAGDNGAGGAGGGGHTDGGLNDAGGGEGGEGGGCADCACAEIVDEATCDARDDCATRRDVFGAFADCQDAGDAMCRVLDEAQCGGRDDCDWANGACGDRVLECGEHGEADGCVAAGCYWWADRCNDEPAPSRCDQPDPASCEAANCEWTARGCVEPLPACDRLERAACMAREECRFVAGRCEDDPAHLACEDLGEQACLMRGDCGSTPDGCVELRHGACDDLDEQMCIARPDCTPEYAQLDCEDCEPVFQACARSEVDCRDVPPDACERTPGCHVELRECECPPDAECDCGEEAVCVPDEVGPCDDLAPGACQRDPRCRVEVVEVCDEGQAQGDADGDAEFRAPDEDPRDPPPPCREEQICVERDGPAVCEDLDARACLREDDRCELIQDDCGCEAPDPEPCDCADGDDCACAQPLPPPCECDERCVPREGQQCEDLGAGPCAQRDDCEWADGGGVCVCLVGPNGEEVCECDEEGGFCQERGARDCGELGPDACAANPECVLDWAEADCDCAGEREEDGACACDPLPICRDALDYCQDLGPRGCAQDVWCALVQQEVCHDGDVPPPDCDDDGNCAGVPIGPGDCEEVAECVPSAWACWDLDEDACEDAPHCEFIQWDEEEPDCACVVGPDGEEDCECGGGGGPAQACAPRGANGGGDDGDVGEPEPAPGPGAPDGDGQEPDFFP